MIYLKSKGQNILWTQLFAGKLFFLNSFIMLFAVDILLSFYSDYISQCNPSFPLGRFISGKDMIH